MSQPNALSQTVAQSVRVVSVSNSHNGFIIARSCTCSMYSGLSLRNNSGPSTVQPTELAGCYRCLFDRWLRPCMLCSLKDVTVTINFLVRYRPFKKSQVQRLFSAHSRLGQPQLKPKLLNKSEATTHGTFFVISHRISDGLRHVQQVRLDRNPHT